VVGEGYSLIEPKAVYETFDIAVDGGGIKFRKAKLVVKSASLGKHIAGAQKAALFVCTIGKGLTEAVNKYVTKGEIARATVLDAVGSEAVEALADRVDDIIKAKARAGGYAAVSRFSPGYGDWTIFDQVKVLKALHSDKIGVKAAKSYIMVPEKSVSACIGLKRQGQRPVRKVYE
jgi:cobalamin-dependent methionine synthase I